MDNVSNMIIDSNVCYLYEDYGDFLLV